MSRSDVRVSQWLSMVLRHSPQKAGLTLDAAGWVDIDDVLAAADTRDMRLSRDRLERIVAESDKQRFALSDDGRRIRAVQGHSVPVKLGHPEQPPPDTLFHGTVEKFLPSIMEHGLVPGERHDVHLSADIKTATKVGGRRGEAIILEVDAAAMVAQGHRFSCSPNGVWLTPSVPPRFLRRR